MEAELITSPKMAVVRRRLLFEDLYEKSLATANANDDVLPDGHSFLKLSPAGNSEVLVAVHWGDDLVRQ